VSRTVAAATLALLAVLLLAAVACLHAPARPDSVARVGDTDLAYAEFEAFLTEVAGSPAAQLPQEALSELLDGWVEEALLHRVAAAHDEAGLEALLAANAPAVTEADIAAYYDAHIGEYRRSERVDVEQVLLADRTAAEEAVRRLRSGEDLERLTASLASPPAEARGWRQGAVEADDLPPELARVVFALAQGETSEVIQADFGFAVFRVRRRVSAGTIPLAQVAAEIRNELTHRRMESARRRLVAEGLRRYDVEVFERNLPFTYRGRFSSSEP
jgi:hypothetical protein